MSWVRRVILGSVVVVVLVVVWNWRLLSYGVVQLKGQVKVIYEARPVDEVLLDPLFSDSLKQNLALTKIIRAYAMNEIGLSASDNYTTVFDQKGQNLLWNLSACQPYKLEPYEWHFPFLGSMPYKGFFNLDDAKNERDQLEAEGYDTRIRPVGGWSTLGILKDPILSKMLERSEGDLAEVIFHELTHATLFIKGEVTFNENLASFIGEKSAALFLRDHFGDSSVELITYQNDLMDEKRFIHHILEGTLALDSLFALMQEDQLISQKEALKNELIQRIAVTFDTIHFAGDRYKGLFDEHLPNNAYFMAFRRYYAQEDTLTHLFETYHSHLPTMIDSLKMRYGK